MSEIITSEVLSCGFCKRPFNKNEKVYIKGHGLNSVILMDNKCRKKFFPKTKVIEMPTPQPSNSLREEK